MIFPNTILLLFCTAILQPYRYPLQKLMSSKTFIFSIFFVMCATGTLLHELGHYLVGRWYGFEPTLHYGYTAYGNSVGPRLSATIAGPLVNIAIGTIAYIGLLRNFNRRRYVLYGALTFFWSREAYVGFRDVVLKPWFDFSIKYSDEQKISRALHLPDNTLSVLLGATALWLCYSVIFRHLPLHLRKRFIIFGLLGITAGYLFWFHLVGPLVLP